MRKCLTLLAAAGIAFALGLQGCAEVKPSPETSSASPSAAPAATASGTETEGSLTGKQLLEAKCMGCHKTEVYTAANRKIVNLPNLRNKIFSCSEAAKTGWTRAQNIQVLTYLNAEYYLFK
jgi:hypothetical protein